MSGPISKPARFDWPPKPLPEEEMGPPADPAYWRKGALANAGVGESVATDRPLDQPETDERGSIERAEAARPSTRAPSPAPASISWWRTIETVWLGLTRPTLAERALDERWSPDGAGAFCWRCATSVGLHEASEEGCPACRGKRLPWSRAFRLGEYTGLVRDVVHEVKFTAWRRLGTDAGMLLGRQMMPQLTEGLRPVVVPVPSTFRRRMARGIDHTLVLARGVRRATGIPILSALQRQHRQSQLGLPVSERKANVSGTMRLRRSTDLAGRLVIVLDDVRTTGATMTEACRALTRGIDPERRPAEVWTAVLGVAMEAKRGTT